MNSADVSQLAEALLGQVRLALVGKDDVIRQAILTLLCGGHLLIEDIPGVGKTTLAKALAFAFGGDFRRLQFTPDLLPSDITGSSIFDQRNSTFEFRPGPVFGNVILVDEINRATPKTQSALLEAMEERQVTVEGVTHPLPAPFLVIATQNTIEMTGTYPLPEAQLDRFFGRVSIGYPDAEAEARILADHQANSPIDLVVAVTDPEGVVAAQRRVKQVHVSDAVRAYIVEIVRATRNHAGVVLGGSPRSALHLMEAAQAHAAMDRVDFVRPDDVKAVLTLVLPHRLIARSDAAARGVSRDQLVAEAAATVPAPVPVA